MDAFYAWQSDTPGSVNRSLVRSAAEDAIRRIAADAAIEDAPRLDQDTKEVPGTPAIADTIFEKVRLCSAFLADVTLTGSIEANDATGLRKRTPNPNVMIELGYAVGTPGVGWERTILVMNTAYGPPEELPFDLRHRRWPIRYQARSGEALAPVRSQLSREIESALRLILSARAPAKTGDVPDAVKQEIEKFHADVRAGNFPNVHTSRGVLALSVNPMRTLEAPSRFLQFIARSRGELQPFRSSAWDHKLGGRYFRTFTSPNDLDNASATQVEISGATRAVTNRIFIGPPTGGGKVWRIHSSVISDMPVERATRYLDVLRQAGLRGPCWLTVALLNLPPSRISEWLGPGDSQICEGDVVTDPVELEISDAAPTLDDVAQILQLPLDHLWREFMQVNCPLFDSNGKWKGPR